MTVENFLQLWSRHNTAIIEVLIALILLSVVYLAFRTFFGPQEESGTGGVANTAELEKTLQKILENQSIPAAPAPAAGATAAAAGVSSAELDAMKAELAAKEKALADLRAQAAKPVDDAEKKKLDDRVKDLEARLAEYEIISEDIADLSFYKEENSKLQKELQGLKLGAAAASDGVPAVEPTADILSITPVAEPTPEPTAAEPTPAAEAAPEPAPPAPAPTAADTAAAVKDMAAAAAATPPSAPPVNPDDSKLMNQFEDFVKKG